MKKYLVGGAVRDSLLQLPVTERDWVVVGTTPEEMLDQGYQQVGKNFPVFLHPKTREEYALARAERKYGNGYTGFVCYYSPEVTLEEDLSRRDLTINAIARDELGNIIDPYRGQHDIVQRCLRHVSEAFSDDSLRVLRVARFAARFAHLNFSIAPATLSLMQKMTTELSLLSPERVWKETARAFATQNPQVYFQVLRDCGALKILFPEIHALFYATNELAKSPNLGTNTFMRLSIAASLTNDIAVRFATLCHDFGKNIIQPINQIDGTLLEALCQRLKVPNNLYYLAKIVVQYHNLLTFAEYLTPKKLIKIFNAIDVWRRPHRLEQIILIREAEACVHLGCKNQHHMQEAALLRTAYSLANSIRAYEVIAEGFIGAKIGSELSRRRQQALAIWQSKQKTAAIPPIG